MPLLTQPIPDESDYSLVASLDNVRNLSTILKAIHFREHATCFATKNGIKVTVENAKCVQANAFIQEPEETLDFDFCSTNVINKIILQSEGLREAFSELDMTSEVLQITMSPDKPYFRLSTFGNAGSSHLDYPKDSDLMESFQCTQTQVNRYKISLLKPSTKALVLSCKVSIRTDNRGFLSLQYMIRNEDGQICFVEYYCCPDEEVPESES
ncbi:cell cycle checkpoint protein RAD1-like protein [Camelus ferus]|nr:cell cycle checkpoint protein RAD1-like protein [Camelus ferus]